MDNKLTPEQEQHPEATEAYDVFISYSRKDSEVANQIYNALSGAGIKCFIDLEGISGGADFPNVLADAIMGAKVLLFVASKNSYVSEFTRKELTFAVNNKGSHFLFPLMIDDTRLPRDLEFLLSNINWRAVSPSYRIEKEMVADIQQKLADPHAGETLEQKESRSVKTMMTIVFAALGIGLAVIAGVFIHQQAKQKREARAAVMRNEKANSDSELCKNLMKESSTFVVRADSLRDITDKFTLSEELSCLRQADTLLNRVDSLKKYYRTQREYDYLFTGISTQNARQAVTHRIDSMFAVWRNTALVMYDEYKVFEDDLSRQVALNNVERALLIKPENKELLEIKNNLNR